MIRWFARNDIASNFLMIAILVLGGWTVMNRVPLEVQPSMHFNEVFVHVNYRGGSPEDVERNVIVPIELALEGMPGVKQVTSSARANFGEVKVLAQDHVDSLELQDEVQLRVDGIVTLPQEIDPPRVFVPDTSKWMDVIKVAITGDMDVNDLIKAARRVRDDLQELPGISQAAIQGETRQEISIEADLARLRDFDLGFTDLADAIRRSSIDQPAGRIQTDEGAMIIRSRGQAFTKEEFENIVVSNHRGANVRVKEVAHVTDGFEEGGKIMRFNGRPALLVEVLRLNEENALDIADKVKTYVATQESRFPQGIELYIWDDSSIELRGRLGTLFSSMLQGGLLVLVVLGLFLRPRLAIWVVAGIPVAFAGGLLMMPYFGMTLNSMSIFGFIIVIGLVVDDAIVTAENVYTKLRNGEDPITAAVDGAKEVAVPVTFGALTTVVAFLPLLGFEGFYGNYTKQIPPVVAAVLLFSLIESKLALPSHLKHIPVGRTRLGPFARFQKSIADGLETFIERFYRPSLESATRHRYTTIAVFLAIAMCSFGLVKSGRLGFVNMPAMDRNRITARIQMPRDTPIETTDKRVNRIVSAVEILRKEFVDPGNGQSLIGDVLTSAGGHPGRPWADPREGFVMLSVTDPGDRTEPGPKNSDIAKRWLELVGDIPDAQSFWISGDRGGGGSSDEMEEMRIELRGPEGELKADLADQIVEELEAYEGIADAWSDQGRVRPEIHVTIKPEGASLGLSQRDIGGQIRSAFFGDEAQRIQRGRDDIRVMVRLPQKQRESLHTFEDLRIRTPDGGNAPLKSIATVSLENAKSDIYRVDGAQVTGIGAKPLDETIDLIAIARDIGPRLDAILNHHSEYSWRFTGYIQEHEETGHRIWIAGIGLFLALYALLAVPFKSLIQPFVVLLAVPFGIIGALAGHLILGLTPSYLSVFGMLALAGVVVNDSLVMVDFANQRRRAGDRSLQAVTDAGSRRFRPILLTSLTTFVGLLPLMLDPSLQAQFLIPMAVSLGFGILFATFITLYLIPSGYLVAEDIVRGTQKAWAWYRKPFQREPEEPAEAPAPPAS
ncbi:multidrug efflux pump subunit AcrB [Haloferula luteola]|uniref:Multidrug efflux pump subunit AcrB n=1 Tax=Haloferula luteola TaxID=595692 RepID=A0A840V702_9BACT|nr:efflux RND transporter permease subunit [Haloferula luteola]MBB5350528.1 multidrug efflux pump subunit AcrB [Haloferula luteola]